MKQFNKTLLVTASIFLLIFMSVGCRDQILNKEPTQFFSDEDIWNDIELVKKYVNNNYNALGGWRINWNDGFAMPCGLTDNCYMLFNYGSIWSYNKGLLSPDNMSIWFSAWNSNYRFIRNINVFLKHIDEVKAPESVKTNLKGQMLFIRASLYAELLNLFGGVPIITKVFELNDEFKAERASYEEGIKWVVNQLDEAATMVPKTIPPKKFGRITKGAVLSLKSQVLLYAASKLHDPGSKPSGPFYTYDVPNKWQKAADAAKAVMDMGLYSLVPVDDWKDYHDIFLHNNSEIIFAKPFDEQFLQYSPNIGQINAPNGYHGWSGNLPTQNVVNAFQMKDGKSIEKSPLYDSSPESIYSNRELRFYANIVYNGVMYRGREVEFYLPGGQDSPDGPEYWNYAVTGYTMRKHMDQTVEFKNTNPTTPKIYFRLAEIYLNYAEAQYHLGNEAVAREYVNKIRNRVHLPDIHSSGKELLEDIRHERRIELVFEGYHRFNDLRRWMLAEKYLGEDVYGIAWKKVNAQGELSANGELTYDIIKIQERNFPHQMYYLPIPRSELQKTDLKQNVGYN